MSPDEYRELLISGGVSPGEADNIIQKLDADEKILDALGCPECGGMQCMSRTLDRRQVGPTMGRGQWFNYLCRLCGYRADRPEGAN